MDMKVLLVGPYPPPHGGVSVHVAGLKERADREGMQCRVLNSDRSAPSSRNYIRIRSRLHLIVSLLRHAFDGWTIHVHTNGHNTRSWLVALAGALAGVAGRKPAHLTLHSGMSPDYLAGSIRRRWLAWITCRLFGRITCVSLPIQTALESLGLQSGKIEVAHAGNESVENSVLLVKRNCAEPMGDIARWLQRHKPVLAATGNAMPEYGISLLLDAVGRLSSNFPNVGCLVMGLDNPNRPDNVLTIGDIPHLNCLGLMSKADVFVRPTFADGDSISVREALALNVPVVASDCAGRPAGTVLFKTGNSEDLAMRLECVLHQYSLR
jgi:glycosyltransferase involved in cell wall biosynthesis